jgi:hypothetical protein
MLPCILLWALVFFGPGSTVVHHGSHLWILVLLAVPAAWLAGTRRRLVLIACGAQLALILTVYVPFFGASDVDVPALAILAVGLILIGALASSSTTASLGFGSVCNLALGFVLLPATV